jgi:hypothetical protein
MATATYCDWQACKIRLAASLLVPVANLPQQYNDAISQACRDAAAEIKRTFIVKGYTAQQVAMSDDARVYNEQLGAYFSAVRLCGQAGWDLRAFESLDCREAMGKAGALVIDDEAVAPALNGSPVGGVDAGQIGAACQAEADFRRAQGYGGGYWSGWPW